MKRLGGMTFTLYPLKWMLISKLKLNDDKTGVIPISTHIYIAILPPPTNWENS